MLDMSIVQSQVYSQLKNDKKVPVASQISKAASSIAKFNHKQNLTQHDNCEEEIENDSEAGTDPGMINLLS